MWQSYHQLLNINDLKNSGNDRNEIEVSVKIPVPAIFRARDRKEFLRNFEPSIDPSWLIGWATEANNKCRQGLGCKFRRNSSRNSQIPFRFGDFAPGTTEYLYEHSGFLRCLFIMSLSRTGRFARPPHCEACLGPSERAYLSLFGLRDSQRSCFRGS